MVCEDETNPRDLVLARIDYWVDWLSRSFASGKWKSYFHGRGYDYQGRRPYDQDPDLTRLDWATFATTGELEVHMFSEERGISVRVLGNLCPSMAFGAESVEKRERLTILTAILAASAIRCKDQFCFIGYTNEVASGFPEPRSTRDYPLQLADAILSFDWRGQRRGGLTLAAKQLPCQRSLVFIISDFLGNLDRVAEVLLPIAGSHDIIPIVLWDRRELELPSGFGFIPLRDLETGKLQYVLLSKRTRRAHAANIEARRQEIQEVFGRFGIQPFFFTEVAETDLEALIRLFLARRAR